MGNAHEADRDDNAQLAGSTARTGQQQLGTPGSSSVRIDRASASVSPFLRQPSAARDSLLFFTPSLVPRCLSCGLSAPIIYSFFYSRSHLFACSCSSSLVLVPFYPPFPSVSFLFPDSATSTKTTLISPWRPRCTTRIFTLPTRPQGPTTRHLRRLRRHLDSLEWRTASSSSSSSGNNNNRTRAQVRG